MLRESRNKFVEIRKLFRKFIEEWPFSLPFRSSDVSLLLNRTQFQGKRGLCPLPPHHKRMPARLRTRTQCTDSFICFFDILLKRIPLWRMNSLNDLELRLHYKPFYCIIHFFGKIIMPLSWVSVYYREQKQLSASYSIRRIIRLYDMRLNGLSFTTCYRFIFGCKNVGISRW